MIAATLRSAARALRRRWLRLRIALLRTQYQQLVTATFHARDTQGLRSADALVLARRAMATLKRARALEHLLAAGATAAQGPKRPYANTHTRPDTP